MVVVDVRRLACLLTCASSVGLSLLQEHPAQLSCPCHAAATHTFLTLHYFGHVASQSLYGHIAQERADRSTQISVQASQFTPCEAAADRLILDLLVSGRNGLFACERIEKFSDLLESKLLGMAFISTCAARHIRDCLIQEYTLSSLDTSSTSVGRGLWLVAGPGGAEPRRGRWTRTGRCRVRRNCPHAVSRRRSLQGLRSSAGGWSLASVPARASWGSRRRSRPTRTGDRFRTCGGHAHAPHLTIEDAHLDRNHGYVCTR